MLLCDFPLHQIKLVLSAKPASPEELDVKVEAATDGVLPDEVANALQVGS